MIVTSRVSAQRGAVLSSQRMSLLLDSSLGSISNINTDRHYKYNCNYKTFRFYSKKASRAQTYYEVLGVSPRSTQAEIKDAYYTLSKLHHPDITKDDRDNVIFAEISKAYGVLGNRMSRRKYDTGMLNPNDVYSGGMDRAASDAEYKEFMRQRGQFAKRGPAPTGRSHIYDFDKFYEMHYGNAIKYKKKSSRSKDALDKEIQAAKSKYYMSMAFAFTFVSALVFFLK